VQRASVEERIAVGKSLLEDPTRGISGVEQPVEPPSATVWDHGCAAYHSDCAFADHMLLK